MGCGSCGGGRTLQHRVRFPDGTVRRYATEAEARAVVAKKPGAEYQAVRV